MDYDYLEIMTINGIEWQLIHTNGDAYPWRAMENVVAPDCRFSNFCELSREALIQALTNGEYHIL